MPISVQPIASLAPSGANDNWDEYDDHDDDDDVNEEDDEKEDCTKSRSMNYILNPRPSMNKYKRVLREHVAKGMWRDDDGGDGDNGDYDDGDNGDYDDEKGAVVVNERVLVSGLTAEIRGFTERFIEMENLKMEIMKETERCRVEMENRRIEMILESRRRTIDSIGRAFGSSKRMKMSEGT